MARSIQSLKEMMWQAPDFNAIFDAIKALTRMAAKGSADAVDALADYSRHGKVNHVRTHVMASLSELAAGPAVRLQSYFREALADPATRYWAIKAYAISAGADAYPDLISLASDEGIKLAERAQAIKQLAQRSGQAFDRELPSDPGFWKPQHFRLDEILKWQHDGCPPGKGYSPPRRDPALDKPVSQLEIAAAKLDTRLAALRAKEQDLAAPSNWLSPCDPATVDALLRRFPLPNVYAEFLRRFSPVAVTLQRGHSNLFLFGASELIRAQDGYSFNPVTKEIILDWPDDYLVIASKDGDPFVLDMAASDGQDARILTAQHGEGAWDFKVYAPSFLAFITKLG